MFIVYKNKGLLVLLYLIVSFIATAILAGVLHRNLGGIFSKIDFYTTVGFAFLFTAVWTWLTQYDFYIDREGNKKKMDTVNELFWMSMKTWSYIFLGASFLFIGNLMFHYFAPVN
jgi:putative Ca2+/H+ antiporter (TMEM165/GDT1 family)